MASIPLLLFFLLLPLVLSQNTSFDFPSFSFRNLTLLGDSYLRNGSIGLTRESGVPLSSCGTATYDLPVRFYDPRTNLSASFSTNFTFLITNPNPEPYGINGLTFFISPSNLSRVAPGAYLGLFNSSSELKNGSIIAVEFDTSQNHVGLDIDGPASVGTTDLGRFGITLRSEKPITAWIDYRQEEGSLKVWVGDSENKPAYPVLSARFDLSKHFEEYMYVGFSASTEGSTEVHTVDRWSFMTSGLSTYRSTAPDNQSTYRSTTPDNQSETYRSIAPAMPITKPPIKLHKKLIFRLGILGPIAFAVVFVVILWFSIKKAIKPKAALKPDFLKGPRQFSYRELKSSTKAFDSGRILGNGAFGTVYRSYHPKSGATYAVKRSKRAHESKTEFAAELAIIASLRHKNLVQLQGWCSDKKELLLVYEFMPNGSLDKILYPRSGSGHCPALSWDRRYNVAVGIASVLAYLHRECDQRVIHRDIKTSNIMLDSEFNARLGDFGLARLMDHNKSPVSTLTAGTMGYLAPEYLQCGKFTEKTDVFSYGVVVLEVCCGRRPIDREGKGKDHKLFNLVDWVWGLYSHDKLVEAADKRLDGEFDREKMLRLLLVGLSCVNPKCEERPTMRRVLQILNHEAEPLVVPKVKPLLLFSSRSLQEMVSDLEASEASSSLYELKTD